ncbi:glycosyltransferase family A protein [Symbioplanes lichenis]|uniref:glycosyltransferase family A protein n=1 Tax=Symbioplanes lichenis TaxID=1629072 RepID=UPI0027399BF2|nr:glycosyltransferase family A protein [Actinoplanes lichenis]
MRSRAGSRPAQQRAHHDRLLRRMDWSPALRPAGRPLDAIIVPASRRAATLTGLIDLAAACGTTLVVLASHDCSADDVAGLVASRPGSGRVVVARLPRHIPGLSTSAETFRALSNHRSSNLSQKRNIGLLLARHLGWDKIMFLDDDIIGITPGHVTRVAHHLDRNRFAGLRTVKFPDNSVVCHANRLTGRPQGIFVSGAGLGVNTSGDSALEVFPDIYNEDWFAFAGEAQRAGVAHVGDVGQLEFNPFEDPGRAASEEFGDLLAEGLFSLFNDVGSLHQAGEGYWEAFIGERHRLIEDVMNRLSDDTHQAIQAWKALHDATRQLASITAADCVTFLETWQEDRTRFGDRSRKAARQRLGLADAFAALGVERWREARFGVAGPPVMPGVTCR